MKALAAAAAVPEALRETSRRSRFGPVEQISVTPGQIWRARRDDVVVFLLILGPVVTDERAGLAVHVAPVSIDPPGEDEQSLVLELGLTSFGVEVTVWAGLDLFAPIRVLDDILDEVTTEVVDGCLALVRGSTDMLVPAGARRGRVLESGVRPSRGGSISAPRRSVRPARRTRAADGH